MTFLADAANRVFILLSVLTGLAMLVGEFVEPATLRNAGLLVIGFMKARVVIWYFMEIKDASQGVRVSFDIWLVVTFMVLVWLLLWLNHPLF